MAEAKGALALLQEYSDDSDHNTDDEEIEEITPKAEENVPSGNNAAQTDTFFEIDKNVYRTVNVSTDDEDSDSSSSESDIQSNAAENKLQNDSELSDEEEEEKVTGKERKNMQKSKPRTIADDLGLDDLPPLQDLQITVREEECILIGHVSKIIQQIILVAANKGTPAVDLDSVLFLEKGHITLGRVLDVIGPVNEPVYLLRFNSEEDIKNKGIIEGLPVFYAPRTQYTNFVFLDQLLKMKGSDASWENDIEPPPEHIDYSDDEQERQAKQAMKNARKSAAQQEGAAQPERPKKKPVKRGPRPQQQQQNQPRPANPPNPFYLRHPPPFGYPPPHFAQYPGYYPPPPPHSMGPVQGNPAAPWNMYYGPPQPWARPQFPPNQQTRPPGDN